MFVLNTIVQLASVFAAIYIAFTRSFSRAVALAVIVFVAHVLASKLANLLMLVHQKTLSEHELQQIAGWGFPELSVGVPPIWRIISTVCGLLFFCVAVAAIWFFVSS